MHCVRCGLQHRADLRPCGSVAEATEAIVTELRALPPVPTVFYGHSMGGLLAVAVADHGAARCDGLVVSCSVPGADALRVFGPPGSEEEEGLTQILSRHGLAPDALGNTDLAPPRRTLAHDLAFTSRLLAAVSGTRLTVPLTALAGRDDPLVPAEVLPWWNRFTTARCTAKLADGGHFFPFTPDVLLAELRASLASACRATRSRARAVRAGAVPAPE
ncbi:thioesterase II family protein [Streptomyces sp. NPDC050145]|uniref:thioesterase II family protein n=1 Tax=Streptomyces sp. NPDC050145 TaxID=3365602 RepID=UPI003797EFFE